MESSQEGHTASMLDIQVTGQAEGLWMALRDKTTRAMGRVTALRSQHQKIVEYQRQLQQVLANKSYQGSVMISFQEKYQDLTPLEAKPQRSQTHLELGHKQPQQSRVQTCPPDLRPYIQFTLNYTESLYTSMRLKLPQTKIVYLQNQIRQLEKVLLEEKYCALMNSRNGA